MKATYRVPIIFPVLFLVATLCSGGGFAHAYTFIVDSSPLLNEELSPNFSNTFNTIKITAESLNISLPAQNTEIDENILNAIKYVAQGDWSEAVTALDTVNNKSSNYQLLLYLKGWIFFKNNEYEKSIDAFTRLMNEYDSYGYRLEASLLKASALHKTGQYKKAQKQFGYSLRFYGEELGLAKKILSDIKEQEGNSTLTIKFFQKDKKKYPDALKRLLSKSKIAILYRYLDIADKVDKDTKELKDNILRALKVEFEAKLTAIIEESDSLKPWIFYSLTKSVFMDYILNKKDKELRAPAISLHEKFIKKYSDSDDEMLKGTIYRLIELYNDKEGFSSDIIKLYKVLTSVRFSGDHNTVNALYELGAAYYDNGFYKNAKKIFLKLKRKFPKSFYSPDIFFRLAEIYRKNGNIEKSVNYYLKASSYKDSYYSFVSLYRLGWISYKTFDYDNSLKVFGQLLNNMNSFKNGDIIISTKEEIDTLKALYPTLEKESLDKIVLCLYEAGGKEKDLFEFLARHKDDVYISEVLIAFGDIYRLQKDYSSEINLYTRFIREFSNNKEAIIKVITHIIKSYKSEGLDDKAESIRKIIISFYHSLPINRRNDYSDVVSSAYMKSAIYHRILARTASKDVELEKAINQYRKYLGEFNDNKNSPYANFLLAETLFEKGDYFRAGVEYSKTAWRYNAYENPGRKEKAALAAVVSYKKDMEQPGGSSLKKKTRRFYTSADMFISNFPKSPDTPRISLTVAESFYKEKRFREAQNKYNATILMNPGMKITVKATQGFIRSLFSGGKYLDARKESYKLLNFMITKLVPDPGNSKNVLFRVGKTYYSRKNYELFRSSLQQFTYSEEGNDLREMFWNEVESSGSLLNISNNGKRNFINLISPFKKKDREVLLFTQDMISLSILKDAENLIAVNKFREAADLFIAKALLTDNLKKKIDYLYTATGMFVKVEDWINAYRILNFINNSHFKDMKENSRFPLLMRLALVAEKTGNKTELAKILKKASSQKQLNFTEKQNVLLKAGAAFEAIGDYEEAVSLYKPFIKASRSFAKGYVVTCFRMGNIYQKQENSRQAIKYYNKALKGLRKGRSKNERYYAINALFNLSEMEYERFKKIDKNRPVETQISSKKRLLSKLVRDYKKISAFNILEFTSAVYYRSGNLYEIFAAMIESSPVPSKLSAVNKRKYMTILAKKIASIKAKATNEFAKNIKLSRLKKYNSWIAKSFKAFARLNNDFSLKHEKIVGVMGESPKLYTLPLQFNTSIKISGLMKNVEGGDLHTANLIK